MDVTEIITLILVLIGLWYWMDSLQVKHLASTASKKECEKLEVEFLDDTVLLRQVRLFRNIHGRVQIRRIYQFEFTSDGHSRYLGEVIMMGSNAFRISLEPHRLP